MLFFCCFLLYLHVCVYINIYIYTHMYLRIHIIHIHIAHMKWNFMSPSKMFPCTQELCRNAVRHLGFILTWGFNL